MAAVPTSGVDVLARAQALVEASPGAAVSKPTFVLVADQDLPADVTAALKTAQLAWGDLSDVMRIGILWAHGYVLPGDSNSALATVYTLCDDANGSLEQPAGRFMDEVVVRQNDFDATNCSASQCGEFYQATNTDCSSAIQNKILCAVDTTASAIPTGSDSFWSNASSSAVPYPKLFTHTVQVSIAAANDRAVVENRTLVSIHMAARVGANTVCGNTGDAIAPCLPLVDVGSTATFCRPKVDQAPLKAFLGAIAAKIAQGAAAAGGPNGAEKGGPTANNGQDDQGGGGGLSIGAILGIAGGTLVVLGLLAFYFFRSKGKSNAKDPETVLGFSRKSEVGGGTGSGSDFVAIHQKKTTSRFNRQGTSNNFPVIDSARENDSVFSTDYVGVGGGDGSVLDEDSRQRPFSRDLLRSGESSMTRSGRASSLTTSFRGGGGKTIEDYCDESEVIRDFLDDPLIKLRRIPYEELTTLRILSKGSYGEVYLGQLETRHVAMKRLLPEKKHLTRSIEQFTGEIRIMCNLEHRNIVTFVGVSWDYLQNVCVIVEYMDNGDLSEVLTKMKTRYTWAREKISIAMDIAEGLVYLHSLRPVIVHRDLKSKNVLLNKRGQSKLSDFGVSRKTTVNETMTSGVGTLLWTAPEIIEGRKYSEKADIFSLGVVLSEIDTCEEPYSTVINEETGERLPGMQIVQMVRIGELSISFRDDCPPKLRELAQQCTSLDPDKRPTSMEVAYTLKSIIAPSLRVTPLH